VREGKGKRGAGAPHDVQRGVRAPAEADGVAEAEAVGEALADEDAAVGEALPEEDAVVGEADGAGTVRSKVSAGVVALGVVFEPVRSVGSSSNVESKVERVMATTIIPTSMTGASVAVRGNRAHGESPAWVRLRTR
jgi:hypothetical protein